MNVNTVFVYGTLKKGQPNNYYMAKCQSAKYLGSAETRDRFPLVIGDWNLPMMLDAISSGNNVKGEVYTVNDEDLAALDEFEDCPELYFRKKIDVLLEDDKTKDVLKCWTYFFTKVTEKLLKQPCLDNYDSFGDHGFPYDTSENPDHPANQTDMKTS